MNKHRGKREGANDLKFELQQVIIPKSMLETKIYTYKNYY